MTQAKKKSSKGIERPEPLFPIVGVGASAGGLAAFEALLSGLGDVDSSGMAFVLVQHLAPDHQSHLTELLARSTRLPVLQVEDGMPVRPGTVYVIPPNRDLTLDGGALRLQKPAPPRGRRMPIDFFFRSLAEHQGEHAVAVVLSGTGSDGTLGIGAIKGNGGMVLAQIPESAEFDGMPLSAIATGLVDYQLEPAQMPAQILDYAARVKTALRGPASQPELVTSALDEIFALLRTHTGHDFSGYKSNTVSRRIERRLAVHQIETVSAYVHLLRQSPAEAQALFRDLLIGVTQFFRDPEAFLALEDKVIPELFAGKPPGAGVRVWSVGCSTGEEAYSLAILLYEYLRNSGQDFTAQVFATDIDPLAVAAARSGAYPANIAADVSAQRLDDFFVSESPVGGYRVHKRIRDMLIFAEQDLLKDPPFSRIDLLVCRNLLIYLGAEVQKRVIPRFHYSLNPGGSLFLGSSESVGEFTDLFTILDAKSKLYRRTDDVRGVSRDPVGRFFPSRNRDIPRPPASSPSNASVGLREMTEQSLLRIAAPVAALVNGLGEILYLHGRTGLYLEPAPGPAGANNILNMAREGLRPDLTVALHQAMKSRATVRRRGLRFKSNGHYFRANLAVYPLEQIQAVNFYLVTLEQAIDDRTGDPQEPEEGTDQEDAPRIAALIDELRAQEDYLQSTRQELESSNEEMQSMNEELQSANEELETSKEELQSVNEELATVNAELQDKLKCLAQANNDFKNMLSGTGIATIFVDLELCILRYTPTATRFINLIPADVGRPMAHLLSNLVGYERLVEDAQSVLDTLVSVEREVRTKDASSYTLRLQPYRTLDNTIEGVVLTFVDITETVRIRESLWRANEEFRLAVAFKDARDPVAVQDLEGRLLAWNLAAQRLYGWTEAEALSLPAGHRVPQELREQELARLRQHSQSEFLLPYQSRRLTKSGESLEVSIASTALMNASGKLYAISTIERVPSRG